MQQTRSRCGDDWIIWTGHDEICAAGLLLGSDGAIGSTFNRMPKMFTSMYRAGSSNDGKDVGIFWKSFAQRVDLP
ncbi:dihydrodipicolinate synthase family protein [Paenibacillus sp. XY044]|uniref:dihydrodipicolinate synthase family protein n=1 Tax=Paenibacillus sp. XY044 TaxID=2026089 RepID=UPI00359C7F2C